MLEEIIIKWEIYSTKEAKDGDVIVGVTKVGVTNVGVIGDFVSLGSC